MEFQDALGAERNLRKNCIITQCLRNSAWASENPLQFVSMGSRCLLSPIWNYLIYFNADCQCYLLLSNSGINYLVLR